MDHRCGSRAEAGQHGRAGWGGWGSRDCGPGWLPPVEFTEIGEAVAPGVLLDTIAVRSVLVTALTLDIVRHSWWPSALANPESRSVTDGT
jgi:hypothetical protein